MGHCEKFTGVLRDVYMVKRNTATSAGQHAKQGGSFGQRVPYKKITEILSARNQEILGTSALKEQLEVLQGQVL